MIILHGTYDNGKIEIEEKDLPEIWSPVEIRLIDSETEEERKAWLEKLPKYHWGGELDNVNIRDLSYD